MAEINTRNIALKMLTEIFSSGRFVQEVLQEGFQAHPELEERDKRFISRLVRGVTEHKITLEAILSKVSTVAPGKMKPKIRYILFLAMYQIFYMETGDHAAVNEAVKQAVKGGFSGLKGFVNGVLRSCVRDRGKLVGSLTLRERAGISEAFADRMAEWYDEKTVERFLTRLSEEPESGLIVRRNRSVCSEEAFFAELAEEGVTAVSTGLTPDTYVLKGAGDPASLRSFLKGMFYVQDVSSALSGDIVADLCVNAPEGFQVLDVCAAPGGKTMHVMDLLCGRGHVISCDVSEKKTALIRENASRAGFENVEVRVQDASSFVPEFEERFDLVIADVPCSGLGILLKKPDIRHRIGEEDLASLSEIQRQILANVQRYVKPGGTLVFSTCTLNPGENEDNLFEFLERFAAFSPVSLKKRLPSWALVGEGKETAENGYVQLIPGTHPCDGFFMARLEKM